MKHLRCLWYLIKHKWFVLEACWSYGILWQGITHDFSKFTPAEWSAYVNKFHSNKKSEQIDEQFKLAWNNHIHHNKHHWQYWAILNWTENENEQIELLPIPDKYCKEMMADWISMSKVLGHNNVRKWYLDHRDQMLLHPETREWFEKELNVKPKVRKG